MSALATPVVWIGEAARDEGYGGRRAPHHEDAARALSEWARARDVVLSTPSDAATAAAPVADPSITAAVERELVRAQEAVGAADADLADRALARADAIVRAHPEAPAAAWLRAEVLRAWSSRWLRLEPRDEVRTRAAWQEAESLDGGRVAGIGERPAPAPARLRVTFVADAHTTVQIDGAVVRGEADLGAGEHALVATVDGAITYAGWVAVSGATTITVPAPSLGPCTRESFTSARREGDRVLAPNATCPAWIAAIPGERSDSVYVARCERDACTTLVEWRAPHPVSGAMSLPQARDRSKSAWPAWATWTLVGVGAAAAASVALVASGVFESRPVEQRFVVGGARQE